MYNMHLEYATFCKPHNLVVKSDGAVPDRLLKIVVNTAIAFHASKIIVTDATNHVILAMSRNF